MPCGSGGISFANSLFCLAHAGSAEVRRDEPLRRTGHELAGDRASHGEAANVGPLDLQRVHEREDIEVHVRRPPLAFAVRPDRLAVAAHVDGEHPVRLRDARAETVHHPVERRAARAVDEDDGRARSHFEVVELRAVRVGPELLLPAAGDDRNVRQLMTLGEAPARVWPTRQG